MTNVLTFNVTIIFKKKSKMSNHWVLFGPKKGLKNFGLVTIGVLVYLVAVDPEIVTTRACLEVLGNTEINSSSKPRRFRVIQFSNLNSSVNSEHITYLVWFSVNSYYYFG